MKRLNKTNVKYYASYKKTIKKISNFFTPFQLLKLKQR